MGDPQNSEFVTRTYHTACIPCFIIIVITIIVFFFYFVIVS